jgi:RNA polymerase sigma factor (sigma-70 family)
MNLTGVYTKLLTLPTFSYKLHTEDAERDLILAFIDLIYKISPSKPNCTEDGAVVNYIAVSVRNAYKTLLREFIEKHEDWDSWDEITEKVQFDLENGNQSANIASDLIDFLSGFPLLTHKERKILVLVYQYGYSSTEIAEKLGTTKQNVNQTKLRAQKKIKTELCKS